MNKLTVPISEAAIRELKAGDPVSLDGVIVTGRDAAHKYMIDNFVKTGGTPPATEQEMYETLKPLLKESVIYHCGPVVQQENGGWKFVAAGPTTSIREEPYQADFEITWKPIIKGATLTAVCAFGVGMLCQAKRKRKSKMLPLIEFVRLCKREGCNNYFVDSGSRGTKREYCLSDECNTKRSLERQGRL